jgi:hypothetical protein
MRNVCKAHEGYLANARDTYQRIEKQGVDNMNAINNSLYSTPGSGSFDGSYLKPQPLPAIAGNWEYASLGGLSIIATPVPKSELFSSFLDNVDFLLEVSQVGLKVAQPLLDKVSFVTRGPYTIVTGISGGKIAGVGTRYLTENIGKYPAMMNLVNMKQLSGTLDDISNGLLVFQGALHAYDNFTNDDLSATRKVTDTVVDVALDLGAAKLGAAVGGFVGSAIPGAGTIIGAGVGMAIGVGIDWLADNVDIKGQSILDWVKIGVGSAVDTVIDGAADFGKAVGEAAKDACAAVGGAVVSGAEAVGGWISSGLDAAGNFLDDAGNFLGNVFAWAS